MTNIFCCFCCSSSSERKSTWAKQIISSWVKGFSFEDRVFSMCTTACFTNLFWQNSLWREAPASRGILGNEPCNFDSARNDVEALRLNVEPLYRSMSLARFTTWPTCKFSRWLVLPKVAAKRRLSSSVTRAKLTMWFYRIIIFFLIEGRYFFME